MSTKIEWTDETWNPLVGCDYVSEGCRGCYAARDAAGRLSSNPIYAGLSVRAEGELPRFTGEIRLLEDRLDQPARWRRPRRVFVNSMSDLFAPGVPVDFIAHVFEVMMANPRHTFQVLTKRPRRMATIVRMNLPDLAQRAPHIWLGTSIELAKYAYRADYVRGLSAVPWLSLEPLLGQVANAIDFTGIRWVVVGGESGPRARPMHPNWARGVRNRCLSLGVPFLFKQWGEWRPNGAAPPMFSDEPVPLMFRVGKKEAGRVLDGVTWDQYPDGM